MKHRIFLSSLLLLATGLAACETTASRAVPESYPFILIDTVPSGALLTFDGGTTCETPCNANITEEMLVTIAKPGYKAERYRLFGNAPGELIVTLEQAAPTTEVEETALPEL